MVYAWCVERIEHDKLESWLVQLEAPLPNQEKAKPTERQLEQEGADFMATMGMMQERRKTKAG